MSTGLPTIAVMMGDPAGIGPEVCVKALSEKAIQRKCHPFLIGSAYVVQKAIQLCGLNVPVHRIDTPSQSRLHSGICVLDPGDTKGEDFIWGHPSAIAGKAVVSWQRLGEQMGRNKEIDGLVLGPIDSNSIALGGMVSHVDDLQPSGTYMLRISGKLKVVPISEHIRFKDILSTVQPDHIFKVIKLLHESLSKWGIAHPRIAVAGINPHAMFEEDKTHVAPAVDLARKIGIDALGPIAPDSVFRMNLDGKYDAVVSMYHDQGQVAVKTAVFEGACTIYIGLPYVMINVPHGSAFDIAGKGVAQPSSLVAAVNTASHLASGLAFLNESSADQGT